MPPFSDTGVSIKMKLSVEIGKEGAIIQSQEWHHKHTQSTWAGAGGWKGPPGRDWPIIELGPHLQALETKEIGCCMKITPVGVEGGMLHVNQALYKFCLSSRRG